MVQTGGGGQIEGDRSATEMSFRSIDFLLRCETSQGSTENESETRSESDKHHDSVVQISKWIQAGRNVRNLIAMNSSFLRARSSERTQVTSKRESSRSTRRKEKVPSSIRTYASQICRT